MFANNEEKKLDWMYKGPNALVNREDYLLGRTVDKTLEQLNEEEKNKATNQLLAPPKNHVEHECIPPSIRDYNKIVQSEQVDLQAKLQEDPLVLIKRQEDETRRQFLQNPIQLKKLQDAMQAQLKNKKKHKKGSDAGIDKKLKKKLKLLNKELKKKGGYKKLKITTETSDDEAILDTILMHKFHSLKTKLSEDDLKNIVMGNFSDDEDSEPDEVEKNKYFKSLDLGERKQSKVKESRKDEDSDSDKHNVRKSFSSSKRYESERNFKDKKEFENVRTRHKNDDEQKKNKTKRLTDEEKEQLRRSMMQQAAERTKESVQSYKKYKKEQSKPVKLTHHREEFMRNELLKSANSSSVADRIKANVNNIQRSKSAMESNFLK